VTFFFTRTTKLMRFRKPCVAVPIYMYILILYANLIKTFSCFRNVSYWYHQNTSSDTGSDNRS